MMGPEEANVMPFSERRKNKRVFVSSTKIQLEFVLEEDAIRCPILDISERRPRPFGIRADASDTQLDLTVYPHLLLPQ